MKLVKLVILAALALFAFAAVGAAAASAEEMGILCLTNECAKLESANLKGGASKLQTLSGKNAIEGTAVTSEIKNCETTAEGKHIILCKPVPITFTGVVENKANCHSESVAGTDKEAALTVKLILALHMAATEFGGKLQPLLLAKVLGPLGTATNAENELFITCALVKTKVKGVVACLLTPGLTNIAAGGAVEISCKINATTHDPEFGTCKVLCEWLEKEPLLASFNGATFEDSWENASLSGTFNKDILIDD